MRSFAANESPEYLVQSINIRAAYLLYSRLLAASSPSAHNCASVMSSSALSNLFIPFNNTQKNTNTSVIFQKCHIIMEVFRWPMRIL